MREKAASALKKMNQEKESYVKERLAQLHCTLISEHEVRFRNGQCLTEFRYLSPKGIILFQSGEAIGGVQIFVPVDEDIPCGEKLPTVPNMIAELKEYLKPNKTVEQKITKKETNHV